MNMRVIALSQDTYWLKAVHQALLGRVCDLRLLKSIVALPQSEARTILLVDASGQSDLEEVVIRLRDLGWRYVVVVAADPSAKEATLVLRRHLGYDYWEKTYEEDDIYLRMKECFEEMTAELEPLNPKHHPPPE
jgi:hypothetical protein